MARSLTQRTTAPTVQQGRAPAVGTGPDSQAVRIARHGSIPRRDSPTELFVTSLVLARFSSARRRTTEHAATPSLQETIDYGRLTHSQDGHYAVFNGFWWASSEWLARQFWADQFTPPAGYRVVGSDTVMIPRSMLQATGKPQQIGRTRLFLNLYSLAGGTIDGQPFAQAGYIRATTPGMAVRLWRSNDYGVAEQALSFAVRVPPHWIGAVLNSPAILERLNHDHVARIS